MIYLNSQAKGPLLDRALESFLINTEGVIFRYPLIVKKISQVTRQGRNNPIKFLFCLFLFFKIKYNKVKIKEAPQ